VAADEVVCNKKGKKASLAIINKQKFYDVGVPATNVLPNVTLDYTIIMI
jgi:hypothetical protein